MLQPLQSLLFLREFIRKFRWRQLWVGSQDGTDDAYRQRKMTTESRQLVTVSGWQFPFRLNLDQVHRIFRCEYIESDVNCSRKQWCDCVARCNDDSMHMRIRDERKNLPRVASVVQKKQNGQFGVRPLLQFSMKLWTNILRHGVDCIYPSALSAGE